MNSQRARKIRKNRRKTTSHSKHIEREDEQNCQKKTKKFAIRRRDNEEI